MIVLLDLTPTTVNTTRVLSTLSESFLYHNTRQSLTTKQRLPNSYLGKDLITMLTTGPRVYDGVV